MMNFESFSEDLIPRIVPQPTLHPVLDMSKPIVPEVSLIFDETKKPVLNQGAQPKSYKEWKQQQQQQQQQHQQPPPDIQKFIPNQTSTADRRKIVTFSLPNENQQTKIMPLPSMESSPIGICQQLDLSLCEPRQTNDADHRIVQPSYMTDAQCAQQDYNNFIKHENNKRLTAPAQIRSEENVKRQPNHTINQIPIQVNNNQNQAIAKGITLNDVYQLLQNMQLNTQSQTDTTHKQSNLNGFNGPNKVLENHEPIDHCALVPGSFQSYPNTPSTSNEPTMKDMFNVILKQQEQLMNIQNQVHVLLMRTANATSNQLELRHHNNSNQIMGDTNANVNQIDAHTKQVGVMTSLEINVQNIKSSATQAGENFSTPKSRNKMAYNQNIKQCGCTCNCESQKQLQSSDSGSNDDNFDTSPRQGDTQPGWTFYGNILNQVNDVLQNTSPISSARGNEHQSPQLATNVENRFNGLNDVPIRHHSNVMPNIRSAQFKQVGFQIDDVNISAMTKRITFGSSSNEIPRTPADRVAATDNSMLMNALAIKYLPCDLNNSHSPKLANGVTQTTTTNARSTVVTPINGTPVNRQNEFNSKNSNTDMSMTSYRYMEKYGLL